jgi:hypothetical protein
VRVRDTGDLGLPRLELDEEVGGKERLPREKGRPDERGRDREEGEQND